MGPFLFSKSKIMKLMHCSHLVSLELTVNKRSKVLVASKCCSFLTSSIGRKVLMSATGMGLSLFLLMHVAGNLLILVNAEKFDEYAHMLTSNPLLLPAELGLLALIALHIYMAIRLTRQNKAARPVAYQVRANTGRSRRWWPSSNMGITGTLILAFIVYHIIHFKYGTNTMVERGGVQMRDLSGLVKSEFQELSEVIIYVTAMVVIMLHLLHGVRSVWDTLGVAKTKCDYFFLWLSRIFVVGVMSAFILIPLSLYFRS